jgi:hypothetical protein
MQCCFRERVIVIMFSARILSRFSTRIARWMLPFPYRPISSTALFDQRYTIPESVATHPVVDVLDDVKDAVRLLNRGSMKEASTVLERAYAIGLNVFGARGEFLLFIQVSQKFAVSELTTTTMTIPDTHTTRTCWC